jgi:hypothetical protein
MRSELEELDDFIKQQNELLQALDAELRPVYEKERAIKREIALTHKTIEDEFGKLRVLGFDGDVCEVESECWLGRDLSDPELRYLERPSRGYEKRKRVVVFPDADGCETRLDYFDQLTELNEIHRPTKVRRRGVKADIDGALRVRQAIFDNRERKSHKRQLSFLEVP